MKILVDINNQVLFSGETIEFGIFDEPMLEKWAIMDGKNDILFYVIDDSYSLTEVLSIPDDLQQNKYCYTVEKGFYVNPTYSEPINIETEVIKLQQENAELKAKLDNIQEVLDYLVMQ